MTDTGNLVIRDVEKSDAGEYFCQVLLLLLLSLLCNTYTYFCQVLLLLLLLCITCQAKNMVGTRSSDVARLSVHVKPAFLEDPEDVTAREGDDVTLHCKVDN